MKLNVGEAKGNLVDPQNALLTVQAPCCLSVETRDETSSSDNGLIAATISAIQDAQMDKAVPVWRCELGAYVMHHVNCPGDHVWRGIICYTVSVRTISRRSSL